jgi:hypothetical protein
VVANAGATTYLVDTTSDDMLDACTAAGSDCSLRGAIARANAGSGDDLIAFDIPSSDPGFVAATQHWRIAPATDLPFITVALAIDGYSAPGASPNTLTVSEGGSDASLRIELHGDGGANGTGLSAAAPLHVRGLAINGFHANLVLFAPGIHRIEGCFIGTDVTGTRAASAAGGIGVHLRGSAVVGGAAPAARNVISGNAYIGIWDETGTASSPSVYEGNLIGLAADGATVIAGQDYGLYMTDAAAGTRIGGALPGQRNIVAGNETNAIYLTGSTLAASITPVRIVGNFFGTDWSGRLPRPNGAFPASPTQPQSTISVFRGGRCGAAIGGDAAGEGNLIAHGAAAGVQIATCAGTPVLGNAFVGNRIGIDLSATSNADGATANDPADADEGGNRQLNAPEIDQVAYVDSGSTIRLRYRVDTSPTNANYPLRIDVGWGRRGQAAGTAVIDTYAVADAQALRSIEFPAADLHGQALVLWTSDADGDTSEFHSESLFDDGFEP